MNVNNEWNRIYEKVVGLLGRLCLVPDAKEIPEPTASVVSAGKFVVVTRLRLVQPHV